jgi:hypothetical protein
MPHVGDRAFDPLRPDGQVAKFPPLKFGALPCDRAIVRRWREQLFHNRRAPFIDKINSAFVAPRGRKRSAIAYPLALCVLELALPVEAGAPVTRRMAGEPPRIAARNSDPGIYRFQSMAADPDAGAAESVVSRCRLLGLGTARAAAEN